MRLSVGSSVHVSPCGKKVPWQSAFVTTLGSVHDRKAPAQFCEDHTTKRSKES
jgi:hypothetical protein